MNNFIRKFTRITKKALKGTRTITSDLLKTLTDIVDDEDEDEFDNEKLPTIRSKTHKIIGIIVGIIAVCLVVLICITILVSKFPSPEPTPVIPPQPTPVTPDDSKPTLLTESAIEEIISIGKISTYIVTYNGVAEVMNEKKPEKVDFYVSYEAQVTASIDFTQVEVSMNQEEKIISITMPEVEITVGNVKMSSLEYLFYNEEINQSGVSEIARKKCNSDVEQESRQNSGIFEVARNNAENFLTALVQPLVEQWDSEYEIVIN